MTGHGEIEIDSKETRRGQEEQRTAWRALELGFNDENRKFENEIRRRRDGHRLSCMKS